MNKKSLKRICLTLAGCGLFAATLQAADPQWWSSRGVIGQAAATNDYAAVTSGQVKWFAKCAMDEMDAKLPGGAGSSVSNLVASFSVSNNYCAVNAGQMKTILKPFYDRLIEVGRTNAYPWTASTNDDKDYSAVNIGQVKRGFCFDL